jgi:hypothetical protein
MQGSMIQTCTLLLAIMAVLALPAAADPGIAVLPQAPGQRLHYHIVRTTQAPGGPQAATLDATLVGRADGGIAIERSGPGGAPNLVVLTAGPGGTLTPASSDAAADGQLTDVLFGLNLAVAATHEGDPAASGTWLATVPTAPGPSAPAAPVVLVPAPLGKSDFDFSGSSEISVIPTPAPIPRRGPAPAPQMTPPAAGILVLVHVDGHANAGSAQRIGVTFTRIVTVANLPFVNASSWTIAIDAGP